MGDGHFANEATRPAVSCWGHSPWVSASWKKITKSGTNCVWHLLVCLTPSKPRAVRVFFRLISFAKDRALRDGELHGMGGAWCRANSKMSFHWLMGMSACLCHLLDQVDWNSWNRSSRSPVSLVCVQRYPGAKLSVDSAHTHSSSTWMISVEDTSEHSGAEQSNSTVLSH